MFQNFDQIQKLGQDNVDIAIKSMTAMSKGVQAIAVEVADYSKASFEQGSATLEKLMGVTSLDKLFEIQSDYAKSAYENLVAEGNKIGELYADLAKETYKPFEGALGKISALAK